MVPAISIGGPGVNAVAHKWLEDLPVLFSVDDEFWIHIDDESTPPRASIWGVDHESTMLATTTFEHNYLDQFLRARSPRAHRIV